MPDPDLQTGAGRCEVSNSRLPDSPRHCHSLFRASRESDFADTLDSSQAVVSPKCLLGPSECPFIGTKSRTYQLRYSALLSGKERSLALALPPSCFGKHHVPLLWSCRVCQSSLRARQRATTDLGMRGRCREEL